VARDLNNLGVLLKETNRLAEAEPLMRRPLAIDEKSFGPEHPDVARDLNNRAALLTKGHEPARRNMCRAQKRATGRMRLNMPPRSTTWRGCFSSRTGLPRPSRAAVPCTPRFPALALFGRLPLACVDGFVMQASENLHWTEL
jgi:Tetratricopeptide repeat